MFTTHLQRTADDQQSDPDPDTGTLHRVYQKGIDWIETSPGYFVGHVLLETVTASADCSYYSGNPNSPSGDDNADDDAGGSSYEALTEMTVSLNGV